MLEKGIKIVLRSMVEDEYKNIARLNKSAGVFLAMQPKSHIS